MGNFSFMNTINIYFSPFRLIFNREAIQKQSLFLGNAPSFCIKIMSTMILLPCFFKPVSSEPIDIPAKSDNSNIVSMELTNKNISHVLSSNRTFKFGDSKGKSSPELSVISGLPNLTSIPVKQVSTDTGKNQGGYKIFNTQFTLQDLLNVLVLFLVTSFPILYGVLFPKEVQRCLSLKKQENNILLSTIKKLIEVHPQYQIQNDIE